MANLFVHRFEVMADFPMLELFGKVGDIFEATHFDINDKKYWLQDYPNLFRKLHWSENRELKDMPDYVMNTGGFIRKVFKHFTYIQGFEEHDANAVCSFEERTANDYEHDFWRYDECVPATLEEYNNQQPQIQK